MSLAPKKWEDDLKHSRELLNEKIRCLLTGLVKELADKKPLAIGDKPCPPSEKADASIQTEKDIGAVSVSPILQPFPEGAEALRAEVAAYSGLLISKTSSIRSLEQSMIDLRRSLSQSTEEREKLEIQMRCYQSKEATWLETERRIMADLRRAGNEIDYLRRSVADFHQPNSRMYQSVKDAVQREARGEPPVIPIFFQMRTEEAPTGTAARPNKRQRTQSMDITPSHHQMMNAQPPSQISPIRADRPQMALNTDITMRTVQSAPGSTPQDAQFPAPKIHAQNVQSAPSHPVSVSVMLPLRPGPNGGQKKQSTYPLAAHPHSAPPHQVDFPSSYPDQHGNPPRHDGRSHQTVRSNSIHIPPAQMTAHQPRNLHPQQYYYSVVRFPNPQGQSSGTHGMLPTGPMLADLEKQGLTYSAPRPSGPSSVPMATSSDSPMSSSAPAQYGNASTPVRVANPLPTPTSPSTAADSSTSIQHRGTLHPQVPMSLDAQPPVWLGTVTKISNKEEHDITYKLFPLVYNGDISGQTECRICHARVTGRDYPVLFYHILKEHKNAFDVAYALAFPK